MDVVKKRAYIDGLLPYILEAIRGLPEVKETIASWERYERHYYVCDLGFLVDQVFTLGKAVEAAGTEEQRAQYAELFRLYTEYRPIIDHLNSL